MRTSVAALLILLVVVCLTSCNTPASSTSGDLNGSNTSGTDASLGAVAVIDLDEVARRTGQDIAMANAIAEAKESLNQQLLSLQADYKGQYDAQAKQFEQDVPKTSAERESQQQQLQLLDGQLGTQLNQVRQKALTALELHRRQTLQQFRERVKPIAQAVAVDRGLSIVVTKNDSVVYTFNPSVDITDEVAQRLRADTAFFNTVPAHGRPAPDGESPRENQVANSRQPQR